MQEVWKDIPNYEGLYQASNLGRIKSLQKTVLCGLGLRVFPEKIKNQYTTKKGNYKTVILCKDGKQKNLYVHRLIALTFLPNPNNFTQINHIIPVDENQCNNHLDNLEWSNQSHNMKHRAMCGNHNIQVLSYEDVEKIREMYSTGNYTQKELAEMFNYKQPNISLIVNNKIW